MKGLIVAIMSLLLSASCLNAQTFWRGVAVQGLGVSHLQIWNPHGSGVRCKVTVLVVSGDNQGVAVGVNFVPLKQPAYNEAEGIYVPTAAPHVASGKCELRVESGLEYEIGQLVNYHLRETSPLVLTGIDMEISPGSGVTLRSGDPGTLLRIGASWTEK